MRHKVIILAVFGCVLRAEALLQSAYENDLAGVEKLLQKGADVNAANDLGATPLWAACQNGSAAMVRLLLNAGANPNAPLLKGETPLMVAARGGFVEVAEQLIARKADLNARGARGQTALMWAVAQKHPDIVKVLLASGADVNLRTETWTEVMAVPPHGYLPYNKTVPHGSDTALLFAARVGDLDSARLLVAKGANVNDADAWGVSATVLAAHSGFTELVEFLLNNGANPNAMGAGFSALHIAIMRRDERMAAALLAKDADPNAPLGTWTPTRRSARDFHFDPALVGATPYWLAARYLQPGTMRLLAKYGANTSVVHKSVRVIETVLPTKNETTTALMAALGMGGGGAAWVEPPRAEREALVVETVKAALELGVDPAVQNTDGRRAIDAAKALRYNSVVSLLAVKEPQ